jgi:hypothetical protein
MAVSGHLVVTSRRHSWQQKNDPDRIFRIFGDFHEMQCCECYWFYYSLLDWMEELV